MFQDRKKIDDFIKQSAYFIIRLFLSFLTILFWIMVLEGEKLNGFFELLYLPFSILIPISLAFLINDIKLIFKLGLDIANKLLKKEEAEPKMFDFQSVTSALVTVTAFLTALSSLINLFEPPFEELFKFISK